MYLNVFKENNKKKIFKMTGNGDLAWAFDYGRAEFADVRIGFIFSRNFYFRVLTLRTLRESQ